MSRILLSIPHMGETEQRYADEAFSTNWVSTVGPNLGAFEKAFSDRIGLPAVCLSSGTAAIHLGLILLGVGPGDEVFCSTLTFAASANPIRYQGATPVFMDSDRESWNLDPQLLSDVLRTRAATNRLPKALIVVDLYGQSADMDPILEICGRYGVAVLEDAAEALGATYKGRPAGSAAPVSAYSFNGNKIITTAGGGMLTAQDQALADRARFLATQARDPGIAYEHSVTGYNYRMSNVLAGIGRGQLRVLSQRVAQRRAVFERYREALADVPDLHWMPEPEVSHSTRWLTCVTLAGPDAAERVDGVLRFLERHSIEARPIWKPMHMQPVFQGSAYFEHAPGDDVSARLFSTGLCLPSGSNLEPAQQDRVIALLRRAFKLGAP